jgi:CheY-like chemotaxis protein
MVPSSDSASRTSSTTSHSVLVVDDYPATLEWLTRRLQVEALSVHPASSGEEAVALALQKRPDVALIDYHLPGLNGAQTAAAIRKAGLHLPWILFSAAASDRAAFEGGQEGALDVVWFPFDPCALVREALQRGPRRQELAWFRPLFGERLKKPGTSVGRAAFWILRGCESEEDLPTLETWAHHVGVSYTSLRDGFTRLGVQPLDARDFMRMLRALSRLEGRVKHVEGELIVGDSRSSAALLRKARLSGGPNEVVTLEQFLRRQQFVQPEHPLLQALRMLVSQG